MTRDGIAVNASEHLPFPAPRRYRRKPVEIEAIQFTDAKSLAVIEAWSDRAVSYSDTDGVRILTPEGPLYVNDNDWIVKGTAGEFYPVRPEIFPNIYEAVDA